MEGPLKHYFLQHFIGVNIGHVAHLFQEGLALPLPHLAHSATPALREQAWAATTGGGPLTPDPQAGHDGSQG